MMLSCWLPSSNCVSMFAVVGQSGASEDVDTTNIVQHCVDTRADQDTAANHVTPTTFIPASVRTVKRKHHVTNLISSGFRGTRYYDDSSLVCIHCQVFQGSCLSSNLINFTGRIHYITMFILKLWWNYFRGVLYFERQSYYQIITQVVLSCQCIHQHRIPQIQSKLVLHQSKRNQWMKILRGRVNM